MNQSSYANPTVGKNYYSVENTNGASTASNHVKYSSYKIEKLPKIGLNAGSSWDINILKYTSSNGASLPPTSFGNDGSISSSDSSRVNATWLDSSVLRITAQSGFSSGSPVDIDVIASPNSGSARG